MYLMTNSLDRIPQFEPVNKETGLDELSEKNKNKIIQALIAINPSLKANQGGLNPQYTIEYGSNKKSLQVVDNSNGEFVNYYTLEVINNKLRELNKR